jgi:hypothetical protein
LIADRDRRFSLLAGTLFRGAGNAESSGTLTKVGPQPSTFAVRFEGGGKKEQRRMSFADGRRLGFFRGMMEILLTAQRIEHILELVFGHRHAPSQFLTDGFCSIRSATSMPSAWRIANIAHGLGRTRER